MRLAFSLLAIMAVWMACRPSRGDIEIRDLTELARLQEALSQLGQIAEAGSVLDQTLSQTARAVGPAGASGAASWSGQSILNGLISLAPPDGPSNETEQAGNSMNFSLSQLRQNRIAAAVRLQASAIDGVALCQFDRQSSSNSGGAAGRSQSLADQVNNAQDLRGDMRANNMIALTFLAELVEIEALLALLLQGQSAQLQQQWAY